jgi:hypothetical protein
MIEQLYSDSSHVGGLAAPGAPIIVERYASKQATNLIGDGITDKKFDKKPATVMTAASLREMRFPPVKYVVPGYVSEGLTILAGAPKLGKSWLGLEMAFATATGGTCLGGILCQQGDVLSLSLEDNWRRLQSRIDRITAFGAPWPSTLTLATEWPRADQEGIGRIRAWAKGSANPRLVIIDVLAMFRPARVAAEGLYDGDYSSIKELQALASELGIAIVVIHHTRKGREQVDPFDKVSGTLGLSGAADTVLILDRDQNGVTLYGRGRDVAEIESAVLSIGTSVGGSYWDRPARFIPRMNAESSSKH